MATVTNAIAGGTASTANAATYASAAFTPAQGDLLVVFVQAGDTTTVAATCTASANGITFTRVTDEAVKRSSADRQYAFIADQLVGASPVSMTVTFACTGDNATGAIISVARVAGMSKTGATALRQSAKHDNAAAGTAPAPVFAAACLTGNPRLPQATRQPQDGLSRLTPPSSPQPTVEDTSQGTVGSRARRSRLARPPTVSAPGLRWSWMHPPVALSIRSHRPTTLD
jgi:hypothetical protein